MFYNIVRRLAWLVTKVLFFVRIENIQNVPPCGGAVICANHRSFWDAVFIAASVRRPLAYIGKEELFKNKVFGFILRKLNCYPVRRGGGDLAIVKTAISLLKSGEALVIFPEGERIRKGKKPVLKPGALRLAIMCSVPLIPVGIGGDFRPFHKMHVKAGTPVDTNVYKGKRFTDEEYDGLIGEIMDTVYALAKTGEAND